MPQTFEDIPFSALINAENYDIESLESEIKADRHAALLLKSFHRWLLDEQDCEALEAGRLAAGADYFLREFMIGARRQNIFSASAQQLRQFGGNWYIISNLEPNIPELEPMLRGSAKFYAYAVEQNLVSAETAAAVSTVAAEIEYFRGRIDGFHQLQDDGYKAWDHACPLR